MKIISALIPLLISASLFATASDEKFAQADKLFQEGKYSEAAALFDDASLETEDARKRIEARYRSWDCLRKQRAKNALSSAESLLYDESELSNIRKIELILYIASRSKKEKREKVLEFGLNLEGLDEKQRSRILLAAINSGGTWKNESFINEILAMKEPDPCAKANALGHLANLYLIAKGDPESALKYVKEALEIKELGGKDRQFYTLVQARACFALKQFKLAEKSYLSAIEISQQHNFQETAYRELIRLYLFSGQKTKAEQLIKRAASDKKLKKRQQMVFSNLLAEIEKNQKE